MKALVLLITTLLFLPQANAFCFNYAAARYHQNPLIVESIAIWESSFNPQAIGNNRDSAGNLLSRDYCLMQINTGGHLGAGTPSATMWQYLELSGFL
jgi:soluble lytic murein transglycosylase-like protein